LTTLGGGGVVLRAEKHTVSGRVTSVEDIADLQAAFKIRIRIRIHMFLGILDPDPDPSIIKQIQGGSDISGPLSKPHPHIKKSYFLLIFLRQPSQLFVEE
jgi:hypothetical protein